MLPRGDQVRYYPEILTGLFLLTALASHNIPVAECGDPTRDTDTILWNENVFLSENITIEADRKLVISPGVNVSFGLDVYLTVKGEVTCGLPGGADVNFLNEQDRLSGGIVLINCPAAAFRNTAFNDLSLALEAVYSELELENCVFNNTGLGVFGYQCEVSMSNCTFRYCDMASRFVRSDVSAEDCSYLDNLQSLMMHSDLELIESFYHFELEDIEKLDPNLAWSIEADSTIRRCVFHRTGVGLSASHLGSLTVEECEFSQCKKGLHAKLSPGRVDRCSFSENKADLEIIGSGLAVIDNLTQPLNYTRYRHYNISLRGSDGEPVPKVNVIISHPTLGNATYVTDERGEIGSVVLLRERSVDGDRILYEGYELGVENEDFKGYYPLGEKEDIVITPEDMIGGDEEGCTPVPDEGCFVLLGVLVLLLIFGYIWRRFDKKKE